MCLDVLRALSREGEAARAVLADLVQACGDLPGAKEAAGFIAKTLAAADGEAQARAAVERLAMLAAAAALDRKRAGSRGSIRAHAAGCAARRNFWNRGSSDRRSRCLSERALPAVYAAR